MDPKSIKNGVGKMAASILLPGPTLPKLSTNIDRHIDLLSKITCHFPGLFLAIFPPKLLLTFFWSFLAFIQQKETFEHLSCRPPIGLSPISIPSTQNSINFFSRPLFYMAEPQISIFGLCPPYRIVTISYPSNMRTQKSYRGKGFEKREVKFDRPRFYMDSPIHCQNTLIEKHIHFKLSY